MEIILGITSSRILITYHLYISLRNTSSLFRKSTFGIHDPSGFRYLFQLRVGLSPLRYHKTLLIHPLTNVLVITALKTLTTFYFLAHFCNW